MNIDTIALPELKFYLGQVAKIPLFKLGVE